MAISSTSDFVAKFHNLDGDLIGERKKSLFNLLKTASQNLTAQDIDVAIDNLDPKTYQEKLCHIETLVYFKKISHLIEVLKSCNRDHIKIVMRQKWFMKEAFKDMSPAQLVNEFFPSVSYSTRLKLLWRIPQHWSEEKNDDLFDHVQKRYGLSIGLRILHTCSKMKIENLLNQQEVVLTTTQIIYLLHKEEDLFSKCLDCYNNRYKKPYAEKNVLNMIAMKRPELFLKLSNDKKIEPEKLTAEATAQLITVSKRELFSDPQRFFKFLNTRALVNSLGTDFRTFFKSIFPRKVPDLNTNQNWLQLIKLFPKNKRWQLFTETTNSNFPNKTIGELDIDSSILKLNPPKEIIYKWAEIKYKKTADDNYLKYYSAAVSVPLLKEKINVTSDVKVRQNLLRLLITTCAENKDTVMLDKVLEYIGSRHRNEDPYVYKRLLELLLDSFKENELSKKQWSFVYQQILLLKTEGSVRAVHFYEYKEIVVKYLEYSYQNDPDVYKTVIVDFIKMSCDSYTFNFWDYLQKFKHGREIFLDICRIFPTIIPDDHARIREIHHNLIHNFADMCNKNPDQCVNILEYPYLVTVIKETCNQKEDADLHNDGMIIASTINYNLNFPQYSVQFSTESRIFELLGKLYSWTLTTDIVVPIVKKKNISDLETEIVRFGLENLELDNWYVTEVMTKVVSRFPKVLSRLVIEKRWLNIHIDKFRMNCSPEFHKNLCDYLIENWLNFDAEKQEKAIRVLLKLLPAEEFIQFVDLHLSKIISTDELDTAEDIQLHAVQCKLVGFLKDADQPHQYIPLVLKFCVVEDLLKFALASLYSLCARYPETLLYSHIETISQQNVPLQKHSIFLTCEFVDSEYAINLLKNGNHSTHSLCLATLKYFVKTDFPDVFLLATKYISMINTLNEKVFSTITKVDIPKKYINEYIEVCCKMFSKIVDEKNKINKYIDKLLEKTFDREIISALSAANVNDLIVRYFAQEGDNRLGNINAFVVYCLAYRHSEKQTNYKLAFDILLKLNKKTANAFCNNFVDLQQTIDDNTFVSDFVQQWKNRFSISDSLEEHIILNLLLDRVNKPKDIYSKDIVDYLEQLLNELGPRVFEKFLESFRPQVDKLEEHNQLQLFSLMLNYKPIPPVCVLILQLLKREYDENNDEVNTLYKDIIGTIKVVEQPIVKCYHEMYVNKEIV